MRLPARALAAITGPDLPTIPAGAEVHVTAYEPLGSGSWGDYAVDWQGGRYLATPAQIEILQPDPCLGFGDLVVELVDQGTLVSDRRHDITFGQLVAGDVFAGQGIAEAAARPTVTEVLDLLRELDRQHKGGGDVDVDAYQARKADLLARIKRHLGEP